MNKYPKSFLVRFFFLIKQLKPILLVIPLAMTIVVSFGNNSASAKDPFRKDDARDIGKHTEQAFETIFFEGDYKAVSEELKLAEVEEPQEPLVHAGFFGIYGKRLGEY